jgi:hypothetical protein
MYAEQRERFARGDIVYGRQFHELLSLIGPDFRRVIDRSYGSRMWAREQFDDGFPQFYVDCRYLYTLSLVWLQRILG